VVTGAGTRQELHLRNTYFGPERDSLAIWGPGWISGGPAGKTPGEGRSARNRGVSGGQESRRDSNRFPEISS